MGRLSDRGDFWQGLIQLAEKDKASDTWELCYRRLRERDRDPHASVIRLMTHLDYEEPEARRHWRAIQDHEHELSRKLGRNIGLQVAALDYFHNLEAQIRSPKVIELTSFLDTERNAVTDGLTGLYNRQFFDASMRREAKRADRYGLSFSLVLLDVDDFKAINDRHGHQVGDEALKACARVIRNSVREIDIPCRYGGEEFALILPETQRPGAFIVSERIRADVEALSGEGSIRDGAFQLSLSGGVAIYPTDSAEKDKLFRMADRALYRSKRDGKNRITLHADEKRTHPRFDARRILAFRLLKKEQATELTSETKNLSQSGALVESHVPLGVGSELEVFLRRAGEGDALMGKVVRLAEIDQGPTKRYELGIAFVAQNERQVRKLQALAQELYPNVG